MASSEAVKRPNEKKRSGFSARKKLSLIFLNDFPRRGNTHTEKVISVLSPRSFAPPFCPSAMLHPDRRVLDDPARRLPHA